MNSHVRVDDSSSGFTYTQFKKKIAFNFCMNNRLEGVCICLLSFVYLIYD